MNSSIKENNLADKKECIQVAQGAGTADLVIRNARLVDVFSGELRLTDIAVHAGKIVGTGSGYSGETEMDMKGAYVIPGLIDAHVHIESSMTTPEEYAKLVVKHGTTLVVADPHEIANVLGMAGVDYMLRSAKQAVISIQYMLPSCVPIRDDDHNGARIEVADLLSYMASPDISGLGEVMNVPAVMAGDAAMMDKLELTEAAGKVIDGHSPGFSGKIIQAYAAAGVRTDHECSTPEELRERIAAGMYILLREGSAAKDLVNLLPGVTPMNMHRCMFCTDDKHADDLIAEGHIDHHLRICVKAGMDPVMAVRMATLHPAQCYNLKTKGAVAPGYDADFAVVEDLKDFSIKQVFIGGALVSDGKQVFSGNAAVKDASVYDSLHVKDYNDQVFAIKLSSGYARIMVLQPKSLVTGQRIQPVPCNKDGYLELERGGELAKIAVFERHKALGSYAVGLVAGFGIKNGAIASSVAHVSHNIVVIGDNDGDMLTALNTLREIGGGLALSSNGEILGSLPLPVAGIMSDAPGEKVAESLTVLRTLALKELKVSEDYDPFMTLSFLALNVIPELKITDRGLFDMNSGRYVELEVPSEEVPVELRS